MEGIDRSIRDVSPGPGFERIERDRPDGLPDGVHTGGAWTDGVEVWKALDGGNAHDGPHYPTNELECLEDMAGTVGFPRNWRVKKRNGRLWLVRREALVYGQTCDYNWLRLTDALAVEQALKALNAKGWELGDAVSVGKDPDTRELFIVDLSCAARTYERMPYEDDEWRWMAWLEETRKFEELRKLRQAGRHLLSGALNPRDIPKGWRHVYASQHRPVSTTWAHKLRPYHLVPGNWGKDRVHTWIVAPQELDADTVHDYELRLAWAPWPTPGKEKR